METKKNDWLATLIFNDDKSLDDLKRLNITPDNTGLKPIEEYKNIPEVQERFKNKETEKFDEKAFNQFYNNAKILYNDYANNEFLDKAIGGYEYSADAWFAPIDSKVKDEAPRYIINNTPAQQSQGISYITETGIGYNQNLSIRELAQQEKAVDFITGKELDFTPNEKGGLFKSLSRPTLVLAQYDSDGWHEENGVKVEHKKGDLKYNKNGKPYYETLGNRDMYGKDVLHYVDTITVDGSTINKFDFLDSDGKEKSLAGTLVRTAAAVAPMFIPNGVGQVYGAITLAGALAKFVPTVGKMVDSLITGTDDNAIGRDLSKLEGWTESMFNWQTVSDKSRDHLFTTENLGNMVSAISGQLFQQKLVGAIPMMLNRAGSASKNAELGRNLALAYMAGTSAQQTYGDFKEAGATDFVAGAATLGSMLALYGLMNQDYFRDRLFKYTFMDETGVKVPALNVAKDVDANILKATGKEATQAETASLINRFRKIFTEKIPTAISKQEWLDRSASEAIEEMMEEGVSDAFKGITSIFNGLGVKVKEKEELDFGFSGKDVLARYGMSAVGGFIGGGIFHAQSKYDTWYQEKFHHRLKNDIADDDFKRLVYFIAQGEGDNIRGWYTKWWKQGKLGSTNLAADSELLSYIDGNKVTQKVAQKGDLTQNDVVYATLMNTISELEQAIKAEGTGRWLDDSELEKIQARGFDPFNKNIINAHVMVELGSISRFNNDFYDVLSNLVSKKFDLKSKVEELEKGAATESEKKEETASINKNEEIKALKAEIKELEDKKEKFLNGEYNKYYAGQSMFILNKNLSKYFSGIEDIRDYVLIKSGKVFEDLSESQQKAWKDEFETYSATKGTDRILNGYDLYLGFSQQWAPIIQEQADKLKNVKWDEIHKLEYEGQHYATIVNEYHTIEKELTELQNKNPKEGSEEANKLNDLVVKRNNIKTELSAISKNPQFVLFTMLNDGTYKDLNKFFLKENISDLDTINYLQDLDKLYTEVSNKKGFLANDDNLNGFLSLLKNLWNTVSMEVRLDRYIDDFVTKYFPENNEGEISPNYYDAYQAINKGKDEFIAREGVISLFHTELIKMFEDALSYLGTNNRTFLSKLKEIETVLKERTNLSNDQIKDFIENMVPKVGTQSIIDILKHFDDLKKNIVYSPFEEIFKNISYSINGESVNIVDLLNTESKNFANSERIEDYIMGKKTSEIFDKKHYGTLYRAILGVITGAFDNTNAIINSFAGGTIENLYELDENTAHILLNQANMMFGKIDMLKAISDANKQASLRIQKDIEFNMRPKLIRAFSDEKFAKEFDKIFNPHLTDKTPYLVSEWEKLIPDNFDWNKINEGNYADLNSIFIKFETIIGDAIRNSEVAEKGEKELSKALFELCGGKNAKLYKRVSTQLSTEEKEKIEQFDILYRLACLYAIPADVYAAHQAKVLQSEDLEVAPIYGQDYNDQLAISMFAKTNFFNTLLDEICSASNIKLDEEISERTKESVEKWYKAHPILHNFIMIAGGAGTGKTTGVVKYLIEFIKDFENAELVSLAPTTKQAKNLANSINQTNSKVFGKEDFIKEILGKEITSYKKNSENGMMDAEIEFPDSYKNSIFSSESKLKVLIVDEISLFTKDELSIISDWAEENGVKIIGLGDVKQNSAKVGITENGKIKYNFTGIEDCFYLKGPELTASLRTLNEAKRLNYNIMNTILRKITKDYAKNPYWDIDKLNSECPTELSLVYYESPDKQVLLGEKLVKTEDEIFTIINRLKGKGSIAIVTNKLDKYSTKYASDKDITIISTTVAQGGEYDYVIVDKDFKADNTTDKVSKFSALRDLYTLSQRSRTATVILDNHLSEIFTIKDNVSKPEYNQVFEAPNKEEINKFKQWKLGTISGISAEDNLFELISKELETISKPEPVITIEEKPGEETSEEEKAEETEKPKEEVEEGPGEIKSDDAEEPKEEIKEEPKTKEDPKNPIKIEEEPPVKKEKAKPSPKIEEKKSKNAKKITFSMQVVQDYYLNSKFIDSELGKIGTPYNSLMKFIGKELTASELDTYMHLSYDIASFILSGEDIPISISTQLANLIANNGSKKASIMSLVKSKPEIYAIPYENNKSRLVARFTNGENSFDITLAFIDGIITGKFNGEFSLKKGARLNKVERMISLEEFKKRNPFAIICDIWGVLTAKAKAIKDSNLNPRTIEFLIRGSKKGYKSNIGNTFTAITSSRAVANRYFKNSLFEKENGNAITGYGKYAFAGIEKIADLKAIIKYVLSFTNLTGAVSSEIRSVIESDWFNHSSQKEFIKNLSSDEIEEVLFGSENNNKKDFRKYQIIPAENLGDFVQVIMSQNPKQANYNLRVFLESAIRPKGKRRGESKGLILTNGKDSFAVEPILDDSLNYTGELIVRRWNGIGVEEEEYTRIPFKTGNQDYKYICQTLFGQDVTSVNTTAFARVFASDTVDEKIVPIASNKLLYVLFAGMKPAEAEQLADNIQQSDDFKYGVMLNMHGDESSSAFGSESLFKPFKGNKTNIMIRATGITPEKYSLDLNMFENEETPKEPIQPVSPVQSVEETESNSQEDSNTDKQEIIPEVVPEIVPPSKVITIEDIISEQNIVLPNVIKDYIFSLDRDSQIEALNNWIIANTSNPTRIPGRIVLDKNTNTLSWEQIPEAEVIALFKTWAAYNFNLKQKNKFGPAKINGNLSWEDAWNSWDFSVTLQDGTTEKWVLGIGESGYYYMPVNTTDSHRNNLKTFAISLNNVELYHLMGAYNMFMMDRACDPTLCENYYNEIYSKLGEINPNLQAQFEELICNYLEAKLNENEC